jgi:hypothetical protein
VFVDISMVPLITHGPTNMKPFCGGFVKVASSENPGFNSTGVLITKKSEVSVGGFHPAAFPSASS